MSDLDVIPFSTSAYIADTQHLSLLQHGAYLLILMTMWRAKGWIPDDDRVLANICKLSISKWRANAPTIRVLLVQKDGKLSQKRLLSELENVLKTSHRNSVNGRAGGIAKALKNKEATVAGATFSPLESPAQSPASRQVDENSASYPSSLPLGSESKRGKKGNSRGTAISSDWQANQNLIEYGASLGLSQNEVLIFAEDMRLWALGNANRAVARKADWNATFKGWLRREAAKKSNGGGNGTHRSSGGTSVGGSGHRSFASYAIAKAREAREAKQ